MRPSKQFKMKFLPAFLALMAMLFAACGGGSGNSTNSAASKAPASQQVFTFPEEGVADINTFDPALASDLNSSQALTLVFTGLVQLNDNLQVAPQLASSWSTSSDGLTWTFHLRSGLKFSDGTPITSAMWLTASTAPLILPPSPLLARITCPSLRMQRPSASARAISRRSLAIAC